VYHGHKLTGPEEEEKEKNSGIFQNKHKLRYKINGPEEEEKEDLWSIAQ
jgi:hypothetical protein